MNDELNARLSQLKDEAIGASDEVAAALDADNEENREFAAWQRVEDLARRYGEVLAEIDPAERDKIERTLGRRVTDLRREAQALTKRAGGTKAVRSVDAGYVPFLEHRAPPKSIEPPRNAPARNAPKFSVGAEVESWCGKCKDFTEHHIVAMVGTQPKQVLCVKCKSRHSYRTEATARSVKEEGLPQQSATGRGSTYRTPIDPEVQRKADQKRALEKELAEAQNPRPFDPRGRYKANEIIAHPEFGKGKVENVLKGSMLVRFREGLKPLNMK